MGILTLEATGPQAEQLAMQAGELTKMPVGWDSEFECASFDSDTLDGEELRAVVVDALGSLDPEWRNHLRLAE